MVSGWNGPKTICQQPALRSLLWLKIQRCCCWRIDWIDSSRRHPPKVFHCTILFFLLFDFLYFFQKKITWKKRAPPLRKFPALNPKLFCWFSFWFLISSLASVFLFLCFYERLFYEYNPVVSRGRNGSKIIWLKVQSCCRRSISSIDMQGCNPPKSGPKPGNLKRGKREGTQSLKPE